jgi:hypothetical protein
VSKTISYYNICLLKDGEKTKKENTPEIPEK